MFGAQQSIWELAQGTNQLDNEYCTLSQQSNLKLKNGNKNFSKQEVLQSISNRNLAESETTTQSTKFKIIKDFETA